MKSKLVKSLEEKIAELQPHGWMGHFPDDLKEQADEAAQVALDCIGERVGDRVLYGPKVEVTGVIGKKKRVAVFRSDGMYRTPNSQNQAEGKFRLHVPAFFSRTVGGYRYVQLPTDSIYRHPELLAWLQGAA